MNPKYLSSLRYALIGLLALASGCAGEPSTHPVSGRVEAADGSAINVGLIEFIPVGGGPSARGRLTPGGGYQLTTFAANDGAKAGDYVVLVSQPQLIVGALRPAPEGHNDAHHNGESPGAGLVPPHYAKRDASPLKATVKAGDNRCDFTLSTAP